MCEGRHFWGALGKPAHHILKNGDPHALEAQFAAFLWNVLHDLLISILGRHLLNWRLEFLVHVSSNLLIFISTFRVSQAICSF